jgi:predicted ferric reductase
MSTTIVFGTRHIFKYFTDDTVLINKIHSYIGKYGMLFVFMHPIFMFITKWELIQNAIKNPTFSEIYLHIFYGILSLFLLLIVWITSAIVRSKIKWRPWKYIHLLSYPIVFLAFIHVLDIGTFFENYFLVKTVWTIAFITFLASCVYRLFIWSGFGKNSFILAHKKMVGENIILIKLKPTSKILNSNIGQHFYLQTAKFKSEHPFTIIRNEDGMLSFGIRQVAGFWNEINSKNIGEEILVDGPYGVFTREAQNTSPKVIISAGIGATPFIDLIENFGDNAYYINCNRSAEEIIEQQLLNQKADKYLDLLEPNRINGEVIKNFIGENYQKLPYFVCGSPGFINFLKQELTKINIPKNQIYFEELGF